MSFESDDQCRACCDLLLARFDLPPWFSQNDWSEIEEALEQGSNSRRTMVGVCWAFSNGHKHARFSDLVAFDTGNMRAVATLLIARDMGPEAVDLWMLTDAIAPCPDPCLPSGFEWVDVGRTIARPKERTSVDGYGQSSMFKDGE